MSKSVMIINGKKYESNSGSMTVIGNKVYIDGKLAEEYDEKNIIQLTVTGNIQHLDCDCSVVVNGDVHDVEAGTSVKCNNVYGDVDAGTSIHCGNIEGYADAGTSIHCRSMKK